jgi:hypothetical protein
MPPKRKAPNADAADSSTSPTPRKKTKAEAKAAAKEWAENRRKKATTTTTSAAASSAASADVSSGASAQKSPKRSDAAAAAAAAAKSDTTDPTPSKKSKAEAKAAAKTWHESRNRRTDTAGTSVSLMSPPPVVSGGPKTEKSTSNSGLGGGNAFLKSLRSEVNTTAVPKKQDPPSAAPAHAKPAKSAASDKGSTAAATATTSSPVETPAQPKSTVKNFIGKVLRFILFLLGLTLNVAAIMGIMKHQLSSFDEIERQNDSEISRLSAAVSKSSELEAVLRSGVRVLEEKVQRMRETMGIGNEAGGFDLHEMYQEEDEDVDIQMSEDKQNLQDALQNLEEQLLGDEQL